MFRFTLVYHWLLHVLDQGLHLKDGSFLGGFLLCLALLHVLEYFNQLSDCGFLLLLVGLNLAGQALLHR